eukprot:566902-Rhodomonas_salina.4
MPSLRSHDAPEYSARRPIERIHELVPRWARPESRQALAWFERPTPNQLLAIRAPPVLQRESTEPVRATGRPDWALGAFGRCAGEAQLHFLVELRAAFA